MDGSDWLSSVPEAPSPKLGDHDGYLAGGLLFKAFRDVVKSTLFLGAGEDEIFLDNDRRFETTIFSDQFDYQDDYRDFCEDYPSLDNNEIGDYPGLPSSKDNVLFWLCFAVIFTALVEIWIYDSQVSLNLPFSSNFVTGNHTLVEQTWSMIISYLMRKNPIVPDAGDLLSRWLGQSSNGIYEQHTDKIVPVLIFFTEEKKSQIAASSLAIRFSALCITLFFTLFLLLLYIKESIT